MQTIGLKKQLLIIIVIFTVIYSLIAFFNYATFTAKKDQYIKSRITAVENHYNVTYQTFKTNSTHFYHSIINNKKMIAILKDANSPIKTKQTMARKKLAKIFSSKYQLVSKLGIDSIQFHLPNNKSFFRRSHPDKYGDDLTHIRYSIAQTNKLKKPQEGLEVGKCNNAFRFVFPTFDEKNKHIGSLEGSISSSIFIEYMERALQLHSHFIINKSAFSTNNTDLLSAYVQGNGLLDFLRLKKVAIKDFKHTDSEKRQIKEKLKNIDLSTTKAFSIVVEKNNLEEIVIFLPISGFKDKKTIAYFVIYDDKNILHNFEKEYNGHIVIGLLISILLTILIFKILKSKQNLEIEVSSKTKKLEDFNKNLKSKIEEEVNKNAEQTKQLYLTLKNAQMGEMIGNIAHQWRQPLSVISTSISGLKAKRDFGIEQEDDFDKTHDTIMKSVNYLSETINTFRDFIKEKQELKTVVLQDRIDGALNIVAPALQSAYITIKKEINYTDKVMINMVVGELSQVIINILNNSKDIMIEKNIKDRWIKLSLTHSNNIAVITIEDSGGGIPEDILPKIFEPYFTTKHQSQGTGLGLHMSYEIVTKHLHGKLHAKNGKNGAKFFIELPLS